MCYSEKENEDTCVLASWVRGSRSLFDHWCVSEGHGCVLKDGKGHSDLPIELRHAFVQREQLKDCVFLLLHLSLVTPALGAEPSAPPWDPTETLTTPIENCTVHLQPAAHSAFGQISEV
ncbi:hypothetical protein MHYP_G00176410 [Metynnis hypsauchen]